MASKILLYIFLIFPHFLSAIPSPQKLQALYNSLDPRSVAQHVAFYELYSSSPEGKKALDHAWNLMSPKSMSGNRHIGDLSLNPSMISALVSLITKQPYEDLSELSDQELASMQMLASHLPNRKLKGFYANSETLVLQLPPDEIDLARGLFLSQLGENEMKKIRTYEAVIDLMAMQILACPCGKYA